MSWTYYLKAFSVLDLYRTHIITSLVKKRDYFLNNRNIEASVPVSRHSIAKILTRFFFKFWYESPKKVKYILAILKDDESRWGRSQGRVSLYKLFKILFPRSVTRRRRNRSNKYSYYMHTRTDASMMYLCFYAFGLRNHFKKYHPLPQYSKLRGLFLDAAAVSIYNATYSEMIYTIHGSYKTFGFGASSIKDILFFFERRIDNFLSGLLSISISDARMLLASKVVLINSHPVLSDTYHISNLQFLQIVCTRTKHGILQPLSNIISNTRNAWYL